MGKHLVQNELHTHAIILLSPLWPPFSETKESVRICACGYISSNVFAHCGVLLIRYFYSLVSSVIYATYRHPTYPFTALIVNKLR